MYLKFMYLCEKFIILSTMANWIFIANPNHFRMDKCLLECGFVEYIQRNKVCVNDIVYLYSTSPIKRVEYKMIVERTDIPLKEAYDDWRFSLKANPRRHGDSALFFRLRLIKSVTTPKLGLDELRKHGLISSMQGPFKIEGELLDYIESQFK